MDARARAAHLLNFYLRQVYEAAGLRWTTDNEAEVMGIVDDLIDACARAATASGGQ